MDLFGIIVLGTVTAIGGGTLREVLSRAYSLLCREVVYAMDKSVMVEHKMLLASDENLWFEKPINAG